jgi:hypothetical protein
MSSYLWLDQDKVNEEHDEIMLDIFVGKALATRALRQSNTFSQRTIVRFAVGGVERVDWKSAFNAYRHLSHCWLCRMSLTCLESPRSTFGDAWHPADYCHWCISLFSKYMSLQVHGYREQEVEATNMDFVGLLNIAEDVSGGIKLGVCKWFGEYL